MFGLSKLWAAFARLAGSVSSLADTFDEANAAVRQRLHLDDSEPEQLDHQPGDVVDEPANGRKRRQTAAAK